MKIDNVPGTKYKIYQDEDEFKYTTDSLILSSFVKGGDRLIDLGCGSGILSLRLSDRFNEVFSVDINKKVLDLFSKSISQNKLDDKIKLVDADILELREKFNTNYFDSVVFNPPYYDYENIKFETIEAKHNFNIEGAIEVVKYLLKNSGTLHIIYPTYRLSELIYIINKNNLKVKNIINIHGNINKDSKNTILIAKKQANFGNDFRDFYIRNNEEYSDEMKKVYENEVLL